MSDQNGRDVLIEALGEKLMGNSFQYSSFLAKRADHFEQVIVQLIASIGDGLHLSGLEPIEGTGKFRNIPESGILQQYGEMAAKIRARYSQDPIALIIYLNHRLHQMEAKLDASEGRERHSLRRLEDLSRDLDSHWTTWGVRRAMKARYAKEEAES